MHLMILSMLSVYTNQIKCTSKKTNIFPYIQDLTLKFKRRQNQQFKKKYNQSYETPLVGLLSKKYHQVDTKFTYKNLHLKIPSTISANFFGSKPIGKGQQSADERQQTIYNMCTQKPTLLYYTLCTKRLLAWQSILHCNKLQ